MRKLLLTLALLCGAAQAQPGTGYLIIRDATTGSFTDIASETNIRIDLQHAYKAGQTVEVTVFFWRKIYDVEAQQWDFILDADIVEITLDSIGYGTKNYMCPVGFWEDEPGRVDVWAVTINWGFESNALEAY